MGFALLVFTVKAPKYLEQFTYSSGSGQGHAGAVAGFASSVINVASRVAK